MQDHTQAHDRKGFTLVELLVVIGIIALLIGMLLPTLEGVRKNADSAVCKSNLSQIGKQLIMYANDHRGQLYPVGERGPDGMPTTLGTNKAPHERWPVYAFPQRWPDPTQFYDPASYRDVGNPALFIAHMEAFPAAPFTPKVLLCPRDLEAYEAHSYVLNMHLKDQGVRASTRNFNGRSSAEVVLMGEKKTDQRDYYMEREDFERLVEFYRHGLTVGSNYLFVDGHVDTRMPAQAQNAIDPWDPGLPPVLDPPAPPTQP